MDISRYIEHTHLSPTLTIGGIDQYEIEKVNQAKELIAAGTKRIGTSFGVQMIQSNLQPTQV